jgi:uncharacterized protein (TIGR00369 family)
MPPRFTPTQQKHMNDGKTLANETGLPPVSGYSELIGYKLRNRATSYAEMELTVEAKHLNRLEVPHGGVLATLIDTAAGVAVAMSKGPDQIVPSVTIALSMQFVGQAKLGDVLIATGRHISGGRTIAHATAEVATQDGKLVARGDATFRILSKKP